MTMLNASNWTINPDAIGVINTAKTPNSATIPAAIISVAPNSFAEGNWNIDYKIPSKNKVMINGLPLKFISIYRNYTQNGEQQFYAIFEYNNEWYITEPFPKLVNFTEIGGHCNWSNNPDDIPTHSEQTGHIWEATGKDFENYMRSYEPQAWGEIKDNYDDSGYNSAYSNYWDWYVNFIVGTTGKAQLSTIQVRDFEPNEVNSSTNYCEIVGGEWVRNYSQTEKVIYNATNPLYGNFTIHHSVRGTNLEPGLQDLGTLIIDGDYRLLGGDLAQTLGHREEPEGDFQTIEYPILKQETTIPSLGIKIQIFEISSNQFAVFLDGEQQKEIYSSYKLAIEEANNLTDWYKLEFEIQRENWNKNDILQSFLTNDKKFKFQYIVAGYDEGIIVKIWKLDALTEIAPQILEIETIPISRVLMAQNYGEKLAFKNQIPEEIDEEFLSNLQNYLDEYNALTGNSEHENTGLLDETATTLQMFFTSCQFAISAIINVVKGAAIGTIIAAPFLILLWGGFFIILSINRRVI